MVKIWRFRIVLVTGIVIYVAYNVSVESAKKSAINQAKREALYESIDAAAAPASAGLDTLENWSFDMSLDLSGLGTLSDLTLPDFSDFPDFSSFPNFPEDSSFDFYDLALSAITLVITNLYFERLSCSEIDSELELEAIEELLDALSEMTTWSSDDRGAVAAVCAGYNKKISK